MDNSSGGAAGEVSFDFGDIVRAFKVSMKGRFAGFFLVNSARAFTCEGNLFEITL